MNVTELKGTGAADTIRKIMKNEGITQSRLAESIGCTRQNVAQLLNANEISMRYDSFTKMISALGYEVIVKKI